MQASIRVKANLWFKALLKILPFLAWLRFMSAERAVKLVNYFLRNGAFKYKVNNGRWNKLEITSQLKLEE